MHNRLTALTLSLMAAASALAQNVVGRVFDASTGEPLVGAVAYVKDDGRGAVSDKDGRYSLSVGEGNRQLSFTFTGYQTQEHLVRVGRSDVRLDISMTPSSTDIDEVVVTSENKQEKLSRPEMGVEKLQSTTVKSVPVLLGETDVIKVMQMMPGVQAASEGSTGFSVRGGNPDQNLVVLDGSTIYNAGHFMGFFSVFNNDAVNDVKLYKGDMPVAYGGRLASTLEVNMKDGDREKTHMTGGIGLISSRLTVDGPIRSERTTYSLSARRSYFDLFLPFASGSAKNSTVYFYDLNARVSHKLGERDMIFASAYMGRDLFAYPIAEMSFGNKAISARWNHIFNDDNYMNVVLHAVESDYKITMDFDEASKASLGSTIKDIGIKTEWTSNVGECNKLSYGMQLTRHRFQPGTARGEGDKTMMGEVKMPANNAIETALFVGNTQNAGDRLTLKYGVRVSSFHNYGPTTTYTFNDNYELQDTIERGGGVYNSRWGVEPRVALSLMTGENSSIKASYTRTYQYLQQASNSTSGTPMDVWYMSSPNVKPQLSDQISVGYFVNILDEKVELSAETFYKAMKHTIDFKDHPSLMLNKYLEGELRFGSSRAYGIELMAKMDYGRWSGWVSYTLSKGDRKIEGVNGGRRFLSPYDHRHDWSIVGTYKIGKRLSASANWVFISGAPTTYPVARYEVGGEIVPLYSSRNADRLPDYHRLDLSVTLQCKNNERRKWKGEWVFSFYNAYSHHNTWALNFERQEGEDSHVIKAKSVYLFPIIPSVSYNFRF